MRLKIYTNHGTHDPYLDVGTSREWKRMEAKGQRNSGNNILGKFLRDENGITIM